MVEIPRAAEKTSVAATAKKNKFSEQMIYSGRQHFAGLEPNDVRKMKTLEAESAKLEKLLAERDLEIDAMREVVRRKW
jgi:putative transposase